MAIAMLAALGAAVCSAVVVMICSLGDAVLRRAAHRPLPV
jgi:hypothetical protein